MRAEAVRSQQRITKSKKGTTYLLSGVLVAFGMAFVLPAYSAPAVPSPSSELAELLRRAEHPGTPGTGPLPQAYEISNAENDVLSELHTTEASLLKAPSDVAAASDVINEYFNDLSLLVSVRIATQQPVSSDWLKSFELEVPANLVARLPGLAAPVTSKSGDRYFNLVVTSARGNRAELRLSESHIQGLEIAHLASNPTQEAYLTLVQYLITRQLLMNHATVERLMASPTAKDPMVSARLVSKMRSLGLSELIADDQTRVSLEENARSQLAALVEAARLPTFVNAGLCTTLAPKLMKNADVGLRQALCNVLEQSESQQFKEALEQELGTMPLLFSAPLPVSAKIGSLRGIIGNAKAQTAILALAQLESQAGLSWDEQTKSELFGIVDHARSLYVARLGSPVLRRFLDQARARVSDPQASAAANEQNREAFIESLKTVAPVLAQTTRAVRSGQQMDPGALVRSLAQKLMPMDADDEVRRLVFELSRDPDFATMRGRINETLISMTNPSVLTSSHPQAAVDPNKVRNFAESSDLRPHLQFEREKRFGALIAEGMAQDKKTEILQLLQIGQWMDLLTPAMNPSVSQVFPKSKQQKTYFAALNDELLSRYPLLNIKVDGQALYEKIASDPQNADRAIDQALFIQERLIQQQLDQVGAATSLHDLEAAVTQSMLLQAALSNYAEFRRAEQGFEDQLGNRDFLEQFLGKYVDPSVTYGFSALLILQGAKFLLKDSSPWINAALTGLSPLIRAFTQYAVVSMVAGTVYQAGRVEEARETHDQIDGLMGASTSDGAFFDRGQVHSADSAYHWAVGMFIGRVAADALLMYRPMIIDLAKAVSTRLSADELAGDVDSFHRIGVRPGDWESIDGRMEVLARTRVAQDPEAWHELEQSALRLRIRMRANEMWKPVVSPAYQRLIRILTGSGERTAA